MTRITLEGVAAKLHWLRSQGNAACDALVETPRYSEALCFLAAMDQLPGGLGKFIPAFLEASPEWVAGLPIEQFPNYRTMSYELRNWNQCDHRAQDNRDAYKALKEYAGSVKVDGRAGDRLRALLPDIVLSLNDSLKKWCEEQAVPDIWDFCFSKFDKLWPGFLPAVCRYMDLHAKKEIAKTADTSLRRKVFSELDFARLSTPPVPMTLVADTRHGKTTAVETYCHAWPWPVPGW